MGVADKNLTWLVGFYKTYVTFLLCLALKTFFLTAMLRPELTSFGIFAERSKGAITFRSY